MNDTKWMALFLTGVCHWWAMRRIVIHGVGSAPLGKEGGSIIFIMSINTIWISVLMLL
jgi:hypothetical protein